MLFKNATVVRFTEMIATDKETLEQALEAHRFFPARDVESSRYGWWAPSDKEDGDLVVNMGAVNLLCLKIEEKMLPANVVKEELKERLALREKSGRKVSAKERAHMTEEIRFELLPKAFSKFTRIMGYIDAQRQEIVIGTASATQVDEFLHSLRAALGSLPVALLQTEMSPQTIMTRWMRERDTPPRLKFGSEVVLEDLEGGGTATFKKQDLQSEEIRTCIESSKVVKTINLGWNDYLAFKLDTKLVLRGLSPMDMFDENYEGDDEEIDSALASNLYLTFSSMRRLLPELYSWFGVPKDPGQHGSVSGDMRPASVTEAMAGSEYDADELPSGDDYSFSGPEITVTDHTEEYTSEMDDEMSGQGYQGEDMEDDVDNESYMNDEDQDPDMD